MLKRPTRPGVLHWLHDRRGRAYVPLNVTAFRVLYQPADGHLWARVFVEGTPLQLAPTFSRDELLDAVDHRHGAYQLHPVDGRGQRVGDPPQVVFYPPRVGR